MSRYGRPLGTAISKTFMVKFKRELVVKDSSPEIVFQTPMGRLKLHNFEQDKHGTEMFQDLHGAIQTTGMMLL